MEKKKISLSAEWCTNGTNANSPLTAFLGSAHVVLEVLVLRTAEMWGGLVGGGVQPEVALGMN